MHTAAAKNKKRGIWASFISWLFPVKVEVRPVEVPAAPKSLPLDPAELRKREWARLTQIIDAGTETTLAVKTMQKSASQRIDAAGYALDGLRAELAAAQTKAVEPKSLPLIMTVPVSAAVKPVAAQPLEPAQDEALAA